MRILWRWSSWSLCSSSAWVLTFSFASSSQLWRASGCRMRGSISTSKFLESTFGGQRVWSASCSSVLRTILAWKGLSSGSTRFPDLGCLSRCWWDLFTASVCSSWWRSLSRQIYRSFLCWTRSFWRRLWWESTGFWIYWANLWLAKSSERQSWCSRFDRTTRNSWKRTALRFGRNLGEFATQCA